MTRAGNNRDPGSYRDPAGQVYHHQGRILRTITPAYATAYESVRDNDAYKRLCATGAIITTREIDSGARSELPDFFTEYAYILEHQKVPYISYPYEWSFGQLKAAALHHLRLQIEAFAGGLVLSDASAYNVQFIGGKPVFIDVLSLRPYKDGEYWDGYTQFCRQFLYPLLLQAKNKLTFNALYRGNLEGITAKELSAMLPWHTKLNPWVLLHVSTIAALEDRQGNAAAAGRLKQKPLRPQAYTGMLRSLRNWIERLESGKKHSMWNSYEQTQTYDSAELHDKRQFVEEFVKSTMPEMLYDLGCNLGAYSALAAEAGAKYIVAYDYDPVSVDAAYERFREGNKMLPLVMDACNPSPGIGWRQTERAGFNERGNADAFIALAFVHHLCIARNIPIQEFVDWLVSIAPQGVVEFVAKDDPTVQLMLAGRADIFNNYNKDNFTDALATRFDIVRSLTISGTGRTIYHLRKHD